MKKIRTQPLPNNPVIFVSGVYGQTQANVSQQLMFLRALNVAEDPKKFKQIIRARAAVDVFRTLDKIAIRKEWHAALERKGIDADVLIDVLKNEMFDAEKSSDRISAAKVLIKSLGLDKYEDSAISGGSWEDEILRVAEGGNPDVPDGEDYTVEEPPIPDSVKKKREEQNELGKSLYE